MTNPTEDRLLATAAYQRRAAVGLCRGTLRFLGRSPPPAARRASQRQSTATTSTGCSKPLRLSVRGSESRKAPPTPSSVSAAHEDLAGRRRCADTGRDVDALAAVVGRTRRRCGTHRPRAAPIRTSGATISAASARWIPTAASIAAFGFSNEAKKPSPVCLTTSPPASAIRSRMSSLCRASRRFHLSSPSVSSSLVESTMSVNRNVRRASTRPSSSLTRFSSGRAPSRSKVASAPSSSTAEACSSPLRAYADAQEHPRSRGLVRRAYLLPVVARALERPDGARPSPSPRDESGHARGGASRRTRLLAGFRSCTSRRSLGLVRGRPGAS